MLKQKFNKHWTFQYGTGSALESLFGGTADNTEEIQLPHDASICLPRSADDVSGSGNGFFQERNCVYLKKFHMNEEDKNKSVWLEFEAVYQNANVYINNAFAGKCTYGYGNYYIDCTKFIRFGEENSIKVVVKNEVPSGRWYTGCGIYRDVNLMTGDRLHITPDGVRLKLEDLDEAIAAISVEADISYTGIGTRNVHLVTELIDSDGVVAAKEKTAITVFEGTESTYYQRLYVKNPRPWDDEHPYLYTYRTQIVEDDSVVDEERGTYGIRKLQLDPEHGLRVNGKVVNLRGGCIHHDTGITGTAEFIHEEEFRVRRLKEAGFNAIRSSHYPMSRVLLNACDKYGIYVMDEFSDVWTSSKVAYDYSVNLTSSWETDIENMVRKDFNHPSVIMYSLGNEIPEIGNSIDVQWGKKFRDKFHELDASRYTVNSMNLMLAVMDRLPEIIASTMPADAAAAADDHEMSMEINSLMSDLGAMMGQINGSELMASIMEEASSQVDITGYNYAAVRYELDRELYPNRIIVGSETYPRDLDINWELVEKLPNVIGDFDWTAWDYLGEAGIGKVHYTEADQKSFYAPYPCKAAYCGDINLLGDRRPVSYWREIIWGLRQAPYIAVQPPKYYGIEKQMTDWSISDSLRSWNFSGYEGKPVIVEVYTDADEAELFINGVSVERKAVCGARKCWVEFDTIYKTGKVEAVVYKNGMETGRDMILSASDDVILHAAADVDCIPADGSDVGYIELSLLDEKGILNPDIIKKVSVELEGPGAIIGYGSADPDSEENYFDTTARTFEGRLRAAVRGTGESGEIKVTFRADGCEDASVIVPVK